MNIIFGTIFSVICLVYRACTFQNAPGNDFLHFFQIPINPSHGLNYSSEAVKCLQYLPNVHRTLQSAKIWFSFVPMLNPEVPFLFSYNCTYRCACSSSLTAPRTTLNGLFSAFKMAVASRCWTSEMLNSRMVSFGAICRAFSKTCLHSFIFAALK